MGELLLRLLASIVIGGVIAAPAALMVFLYGLVSGHSLAEAARAAGESFVNIAGEVLAQT
jgi:hypothetical protein